MSIFQQRLMEAIARKGYNVGQLEEKTGVANSTIYDYFSKNRVPTAITLCKLADVLDVTMDWLWGRNPDGGAK